jgi:hypothetical protein
VHLVRQLAGFFHQPGQDAERVAVAGEALFRRRADQVQILL